MTMMMMMMATTVMMVAVAEVPLNFLRTSVMNSPIRAVDHHAFHKSDRLNVAVTSFVDGVGVDCIWMVHKMEFDELLQPLGWQLSILFVTFVYGISSVVIQLFRMMSVLIVSVLAIYKHHQLPIADISIHAHAMLPLD